jgi:hypothetical protein
MQANGAVIRNDRSGSGIAKHSVVASQNLFARLLIRQTNEYPITPARQLRNAGRLFRSHTDEFTHGLRATVVHNEIRSRIKQVRRHRESHAAESNKPDLDHRSARHIRLEPQ